MADSWFEMKHFLKFFVFMFWILIYSFHLVVANESFRKNIFSTKTAYKWVIDVEKHVLENEFMITKHDNKHCVAVNSQLFLRHGARYPGYKDIRKMSLLHHKLKNTVKNEMFSFLNEWEIDFPESEEKTLVDEGEEEHYLLGSRYAKRLFGLFKESLENVKFISSSKDRCTDSAKAFYEGFTEVILHEAHDDLKPEINDDILRFHTKCNKFIVAVENNRTFMAAQKNFKDSPEMLTVMKNVEKRLGLENSKIDAGELKLIYFLCTFEMIILDKDDWCKLMTDVEREVLEYHNDLKQYWKKAYGHPVIAQMACPLVKTIFDTLDKTINSLLNNRKQRGNVAAFYFGHTESLAPLYAALSLFNDSEPLLDTNYQEMKNRQFKSTNILPFSANIALILYKCNHENHHDPSHDDFVLRMFANEKPVKVPACDEYVCSYKEVREFYSRHIDGCDFEKACFVSQHDEL